jgi:hypothetical protein
LNHCARVGAVDSIDGGGGQHLLSCLVSNLLLRSSDKTIVMLGVLQDAFSRD